MKVEAIPLFDAPAVEAEPSEHERQWTAWRKACPLRKLARDRLRSLPMDPAVPGGWASLLGLLADGLRVDIPPALAARMGEQLAHSMRAWIAQRPPLPWAES